MSPIDYSQLPLSKGVPRCLLRHRKQADADAELQRAYRIVEIREDHTCQISGVLLFPFAREEKRRREHHHLVSRRIRPEWRADPKRIVLVSAAIHKLLTANVILVDGTDATKPLVFTWNRHIIAPNREPMRLARVT